jgi:hypothetical protein
VANLSNHLTPIESKRSGPRRWLDVLSSFQDVQDAVKWLFDVRRDSAWRYQLKF